MKNPAVPRNNPANSRKNPAVLQKTPIQTRTDTQKKNGPLKDRPSSTFRRQFQLRIFDSQIGRQRYEHLLHLLQEQSC
jgi:hypothetical protein